MKSKIREQIANKLTAHKIDPDFVPYVCHYDPNTILTKNGELMTVIRVTGFSSTSAISEIMSLRDAVRRAILGNVKSDKFAFWFNTIRRKKDITPDVKEGGFSNYFSSKLNESWVQSNKFDDQYINELYISIIIEGLDTSFSNVGSFMRSFSYYITKSRHQQFLQQSHKMLSKVTNDILEDIKDYGAVLLGMKEWEGVLYSGPMRFLGKILNLHEGRYPVVMNDISSELSSHKIVFGDREVMVSDGENKNYAAMLSIKEYFEAPMVSLDKILNLPFEFIITQSFDFAFDKKELEPYEYKNYILDVSGDNIFRDVSGIARFVESNKGRPTDYGKAQNTVMVIANSKEELEKTVQTAFDRFSELGFVIIREDIFSEHCFWSQLPGNFSFLRRQKLINTSNIAGFSTLQGYSSGSMAGNHWGPAITVMKTILGTPYFFNFHTEDNGHTLIVGKSGSGKTELMNFLLSQAQRIQHKLFYIDYEGDAECFIHALEGKYYRMDHDLVGKEDFLSLNPLQIPSLAENKEFLSDFFTSLIIFTKNPVPQEELDAIPQIIDHIVDTGISDFVSAVAAFNTKETHNIYTKLKVWCGEKLKYIFGAEKEIDWSGQISAFNLSKILSKKPVAIAVVNYLLHAIEQRLTGEPTIIVLEHAIDLLDNAVSAPGIDDLLRKIKEKNGLVIFTIDDVAQIASSEAAIAIKKNIATEIYMPNRSLSEEDKFGYQEVLSLLDNEVKMISLMDPGKYHFLLKSNGDSVILSADFLNDKSLKKILAADEKSMKRMNDIIATIAKETGKTPTVEEWIPKMFK